MPAVKRWIDWAGGAVKISRDGLSRVPVVRRDLKWKWLMVAATPLPWCPLCGAIVPPKAHKYRGERAMEIHERVCWEFEEDEPEHDQIQLETGEDNGTVQQEAGPEAG